MVDLIPLMKQIYQNRDLGRIDELMSTTFDETKLNVTLGTGFGELCITFEERKSIFWKDLKYWDDLSIDDQSYTLTKIDDLDWLCIKATSFSKPYKINAQSSDYVKMVKDIAGNTGLTAYQRATEIEWFLSSVLIPSGLEQQVVERPIEINMILENQKVRFMCFSYIKLLEQSDAIYNWENIHDRYNRFISISQFKKNDKLLEELTKEGLRNVEIKMVDDRIFFGIALVDFTKDLEQRLSECVNDIGSDLSSLFEIRRNIAFTRMQYSDFKKPQAVVRFFGICDNSGIKKIKYFYPNY